MIKSPINFGLYKLCHFLDVVILVMKILMINAYKNMKAMLELGIHTINEVQFNAYKNIEISI